MTRRWFAASIALGFAAALAVACTGDDGDETLDITHPPAGAEVTVPFQVTVECSVPLGIPDEGFHHLHIWFSDDETGYLVVESTVAEITNVPPGAHEMYVSLRNADHSETGVEASVPIVVRSGPG